MNLTIIRRGRFLNASITIVLLVSRRVFMKTGDSHDPPTTGSRWNALIRLPGKIQLLFAVKWDRIKGNPLRYFRDCWLTGVSSSLFTPLLFKLLFKFLRIHLFLKDNFSICLYFKKHPLQKAIIQKKDNTKNKRISTS